MPRIVLSSQGTYGDFWPLLLLGRRLAAKGHQVRMVVNPAMVEEAQRAGIEAVPCGTRLDDTRGRHEAFRFDSRHPWTREQQEESWQLLDLEGNFRTLLGACADADLLIAASLQQAAPMVQEVLGLPWAVVSLLPNQFPLEEGHRPGLRFSETTPSGTSAAPGRDLLVRLLDTRQRLGLRRLAPQQLALLAWSAPLIMLATSRFYCALRPEVASRVHVTGFWFDDEPLDWRPPPELAAFLAAGPEPIVLAFSSLPLIEPAAVLRPVVEAAAALGCRLVVQRGWAGFTPDLLPPGMPDNHVAWIDQAPHSWLFRKASAIVHHGGVGTTAAALRAGRPALVIPFGNDQPFNADRVVQLRAGQALAPADVSTVAVTSALTSVLADAYRGATAQLAAQMASERGLEAACDLIERLLGHPQLGRPSPIPKVVHQFSPDGHRVSVSWQRHNLHWEYRPWTEADVYQLITQHFPRFLPMYDGQAGHEMRLAVARYFILAQHGGVYAASDFECQAPLELVVASRELVVGLRGDGLIGADVLASRPGHPFWRELLEAFWQAKPASEWLDGAVLLTRTLKVSPSRDSITVEPPQRFYPIGQTPRDRGAGGLRRACLPHERPIARRQRL